MLSTIDNIRRNAVISLDHKTRGKLGQFMTPSSISQFMNSIFENYNQEVHLLDAGAGSGSLSAAFLNQQVCNDICKKINITAYEIDPILLPFYQNTVSSYKEELNLSGKEVKVELFNKDFILDAVNIFKTPQSQLFSHVILNPPYKKINSTSIHRKTLSSLGIETINLYSAFTALSILLLQDGGELVAIIPRSFCNGNYYKSFRELIIKETSIKRIHLFESRDKAFGEDSVLQENVILYLQKGKQQKDVIISKSTDGNFDDIVLNSYPFDQIVKKENPELFIYIPEPEKNYLKNSDLINKNLSDLEISISTGPVVDFRAKEYISHEPIKDFVPLLYPSHFNGKEIEWPKAGKKPNSIALNEVTKKMLFPSGYYTVVRRFSSKEEKQRIYARVINPNKLKSRFIGIENHLNVFHSKKSGISENLAYGLAAYLNSSLVDDYFRSFSGHTQVNATDLRQMRYPSATILEELGIWAKTLETFDRELIDKRIEGYV